MQDTGGYTRDAKELAILQSYPLWLKVKMTQERIRDWVYHYGEDGVVVSFSGGKDSTVLLHLVRQEFPDVKAVFSNTGLEYSEIQRFIKSFDNVDIVTPKMRFDEVISTYGYPLISKEVAESIYYARRIRTPEQHTNRSEALTGILAGRSQDVEERAIRIGGGGSQWKTFEPFKRDRWLLSGFRSTVGVEAFKSQFNKEKYLPLARDIPFAISHLCCSKMKKSPIKAYQRKHGYVPFLWTLAEESRIRKQAWIRRGCNAFESKSPTSQPLSFWTEQDILRYIVDNDLSIASVYGDIVAVDGFGNEYDPHNTFIPDCKLKCTGCDRTGCLYCGFGFHNERGMTRFQRLAITHPRQYEYCIGGGQWVDNPAYDPTAPKFDGEWQNWNPKKIWVPSKKGLGMGKVFDMCNEIYGKGFYRYE